LRDKSIASINITRNLRSGSGPDHDANLGQKDAEQEKAELEENEEDELEDEDANNE
jgi:hypothetical protein